MWQERVTIFFAHWLEDGELTWALTVQFTSLNPKENSISLLYLMTQNFLPPVSACETGNSSVLIQEFISVTVTWQSACKMLSSFIIVIHLFQLSELFYQSHLQR